MSVIDKINSSACVKKLNTEELITLCGEIRQFLLDSVSVTGGHLASNLGVVELTVALHRVFNFDNDKIIFDVGHQSYVHKILTGRKDEFSTLRQMSGLSGFPKVSESKYDFFDTGHSSDSLSIATGLKRADKLKGNNSNVIALVGDGSFGGGMIYEAMNDAGCRKDNIIVVLNDNGMSISKNDSSLSKHLKKLRISSSYISTKRRLERKLIPVPGLARIMRKAKEKVRRAIVGETVFENLGFKYYGPYDGHNIEELTEVFEGVKMLNKPVVIHVRTKKGKGYTPAEKAPDGYHGVSPFNLLSGLEKKSDEDYSKRFGKTLSKLAKKDENIVAVTAAMPAGTGLCEFASEYPDRFFDVGICEEHAVSLCAGMAVGGLKPVFAVYSTFLQRGFDQIITNVALMNLPVVFCVDRAGLVGADGETHQGIFDISYLRSIPGLTVMSPSSFEEFEKMLELSLNEIKGPVAIRYPRGNTQAEYHGAELQTGKCEVVSEGTDITLIAEGIMVSEAEKIKNLLSEDNISAEIINLRFIKPIDTEGITKSLSKTKKGVVLECGVSAGGIGEAILSAKPECVSVILKNTGDTFVEHGKVSELMAKLKIDAQSVYKDILKEFYGR